MLTEGPIYAVHCHRAAGKRLSAGSERNNCPTEFVFKTRTAASLPGSMVNSRSGTVEYLRQTGPDDRKTLQFKCTPQWYFRSR